MDIRQQYSDSNSFAFLPTETPGHSPWPEV